MPCSPDTIRQLATIVFYSCKREEVEWKEEREEAKLTEKKSKSWGRRKQSPVLFSP